MDKWTLDSSQGKILCTFTNGLNFTRIGIISNIIQTPTSVVFFGFNI